MRNIIHFVVIFTFSLSIIAPACGFAWGNNGGNSEKNNISNEQGFFIEICTARGIETRFIANDGSSQSVPSENQTPHKTKNQCQFCFAASHLNALTPQNISIEFLYSYGIKQIFAQYEIILLSRETSHEQPRGPPTFI